MLVSNPDGRSDFVRPLGEMSKTDSEELKEPREVHDGSKIVQVRFGSIGRVLSIIGCRNYRLIEDYSARKFTFEGCSDHITERQEAETIATGSLINILH
jgi:hypothetical protein